MHLHKNSLRKQAAALCLSAVMTAGAFNSYGAGYDKVSDGVYQMLDGTSVTGVVARGIDVSHWKGDIDWQQVAGDDVTFAMLGTRYSGQVDPQFHKNAQDASAAGIRLGAYIYSYATDTAMAEAEADFILDLIKDYPISYPVAFDIEDSSQSSLPPQQISDIINAFCKKIEAAGYHPMLYANDYWLANRIDLSQVTYDVWVARYEVKHIFENPAMWQATSSGTVNGVSGGVDINFQYKDFSRDIAPNLWRTINGTTYYYQNYVMQKNTWIDDGSGWFYLNAGGQPSTGWLTQDGTSYYLDTSSGRMAQGWLQMSDGWRYFNTSGAMQTGWLNDGAAWYHLNNSGIMSTGWIEDSSRWYYLSPSGSMMTGWLQDGANRYYLNPADGVMLANTQITVDGILYDVNASGVCQEATPPETTGQTAPDSSAQPGATQPGATDPSTTLVPPVTNIDSNAPSSNTGGGSVGAGTAGTGTTDPGTSDQAAVNVGPGESQGGSGIAVGQQP